MLIGANWATEYLQYASLKQKNASKAGGQVTSCDIRDGPKRVSRVELN